LAYPPAERWELHVTLEELLIQEHVDDTVAAHLADRLRLGDPADVRHGDEPFFGPESVYESAPADRSVAQDWWDQLRRGLAAEARFFNEGARRHMERLFGTQGVLPHGLHVVEIAPRERPIFRARRAKTRGEALAHCERPDVELGAPPIDRHTAGRMHPYGMRVFYGSFAQKTAIEEVRPLVSEFVAVGRFMPSRRLRVLDTLASGSAHPVSCFDADYERARCRIAFYSELDTTLSRPVLPDDSQLEYLPSQAVAEYVRTIHGLDGIIYSSAQNQGPFRTLDSIEERRDSANIALFEPITPAVQSEAADPFHRLLACEGHSIQHITRARFQSTPVLSDDELDCDALDRAG